MLATRLSEFLTAPSAIPAARMPGMMRKVFCPNVISF